ncbi:MAG: radical SAM protein [Clostridiales bacterium]
MKAKIITSDYSSNRQELYKLIPLDAPFNVHIEPSGLCNLRCNFCELTLSKEEMAKRKYHHYSMMSRQTMDIIVDQLQAFPQKIKTVSYFGCGEPVLNKDLPYLVGQLYEKRIAEKQFLSTNGVLLTSEMSESLISATEGGNNLTIKLSINGFSNDSFKEIVGVEVDFKKYMEQLEYLYKIKRNARIIAKAVTTSFDVAGISKEDFFNLFGDICDEIVVENTLINNESVEYKGKAKKNIKIIPTDLPENVQICPVPFYKLFVENTGDVSVAGCSYCLEHKTFISNIREASLQEIWNSDFRKSFLRDLLLKQYTGLALKCKDCVYRRTTGTIHDFLDPYAEEILARLSWEKLACARK